MLKSGSPSIYLVTYLITQYVCFVNPLEEKMKIMSNLTTTSKVLSINKVTAKPMSSDVSHEEILSKKGDMLQHMNNSSKSPFLFDNSSVEPHKTHKRILINTNKTYPVTSSERTSELNNRNVIAVEGGTISLSDISKNKTAVDNNTLPSSNSSKIESVSVKIQNRTISGNITFHPSPVDSVSAEPPKSKKIPHRPPILQSETSSSTATYLSSSFSPGKKRKKKPFYTKVPSDQETIEDSFIESSTTGRDYVLPIVLIILALPLVGYIVRLIYQRGTEFTERQQYHRMYLIDGMYNSR